MKKLFGLLNLLIILIFSNQSLADEKNYCDDGGIIYGDKWAFLVSAPNGWNMSTTTNLGVNVAFFQKDFDKNAGNTPAFMYVTVTKKSKAVPDINQYIKEDEKYFREDASNLKINKSPKVQVKNKNVVIHQFDNTGNHRSEYVAYQEYEDWIFSIVLTAPSSQDLLNKQPAFVDLLDSFQPMLKTP